MTRKALIVQGGWAGHTPRQSAELFAPLLKEKGFEVEIADTLDVYADKAKMSALSLVVPLWTMGQIKPEQEKGLLAAVHGGVGLGGFHGGMCDSFRGNIDYQFMTGGQFMAHPGELWPQYNVQITDREHEITRGLGDFTLRNTERYWMLVDPSVKVLAKIYFEDFGVLMPYVWTKRWGQGRVFFVAYGHTSKDFDGPEARELVLRGMLWAAK